MLRIETLDVCGDTLEIQWTGSVWVSPCNGRQHASKYDAMRDELEAYLGASGEDVSDSAVIEQIDGWLSNLD